MKPVILIVSPHPDDETLGCGGTILNYRRKGISVCWMIVTEMAHNSIYTDEAMATRADEIASVAKSYGFSDVIRLGFAAAELDRVPTSNLVANISKNIRHLSPTHIYLPWPGDVHSDHKHVFDCCIASSKWFRSPSVEQIFAYETQSETDFDLNPTSIKFTPNFFQDISEHLEEKIEIANLYKSEFRNHPFPRSATGIKALATIRGAASGFDFAEGFMMLRYRSKA